MGAGSVLVLLGLIALFSSQNNTIKEVCDRMPYTKNQPMIPGLNGDGGHWLHIEDVADGYIPHQTYNGMYIFKFNMVPLQKV